MSMLRAVFPIGLAAALALAGLVLVGLPAPRSADALIHEKIAAACRAGGEEVVPPGQAGASNGNSFVRALQASGVIESIDTSVPGQVTVNFDLDKPSSKFMSAGFDQTIPDGIAPGVDLILSPLPVLDPSFPAHANCHNLNP
jgi:hypothetical protein